MDNTLIDSRPPYDAWLHWETYSPCNFRCRYCGSVKNPARKIDIDALIRTLEATGRTFRVSFTGGGEPFLVPNLIEACVALSARHYLSFNTHLTARSFDRFLAEVDPCRVVHIVASAHIEELMRLQLLNKFSSNFHAAKANGISINVNAVADPPLLRKLDLYRRVFESKKIDLTFLPLVGPFQGRSYPEAYTNAELRAFGMTRNDTLRHLPEGSLCNAGYNAVVATPEGDVYPCFDARTADMRSPTPGSRGLRLGHVYSGFRFLPDLIRCPYKTCTCPMNKNDAGLFQVAKAEAASLP